MENGICIKKNVILYEGVKLINLTPYEVKLFCGYSDDVIFVIPPCDFPVRLDEDREFIKFIGKIPIHYVSYKLVDNMLPSPEKNIYYVVSRLVAETCRRNDLLIPDLAIKNKDKKIIGCRGFAVVDK